MPRAISGYVNGDDGYESPSPVTVSAAPVEKLRYRWKPGDKHAFSFSVEAEVNGVLERQTGQTAYTVKSRSKISDFGGAVEIGHATGSGFAVSEDGYLITCGHVVAGSVKIDVTVDGNQYEGQVVAMDKSHDLAIVRIPAHGLTRLPLTDSNTLELAQEVRVVGYPVSSFLGNSLKVTRGSLAGFVENGEQRMIQVDAAINPGNSGGPVVNEQGEAIGVASSILAGEEYSNLGFVVPSNYVKDLLRKHGIGFATRGTAYRMEGPELARTVMPSTAFFEVTTGPDGVGVEERYVLDFRGMLVKDSRPRSSTGRYSSGISGLPASESGRTLADLAGEVHDVEGELELPFVFGSIGQVGIEPLPPEGETTWTTQTIYLISRLEAEPNPTSRRSAASPFSRLRSRYGSSPSVRLVMIPAIETVLYEIQSDEGDQVVISKSYELQSLADENSNNSFVVEGEGTIHFDRSIGVPTKMEFQATFSQSTAKPPIRVPIRYSYERVDPSQAPLLASRGTGSSSSGAAASSPRRRTPPKSVAQPTISDHLATLRSKSANFSQKYIALSALARTEPDESKRREVADLLEGYLSDSNTSLQKTAIKAIGEWGSEANLKVLLPMIEDPDLGTRWAALGAVGKIGGEEAAKVVADRMANDSTDMLTAARALREMGPSAESATLGLLGHRDVQVRMQACHILGEIGTKKCLDALKSHRENDPHISGRSAAGIAIADIERRG